MRIVDVTVLCVAAAILLLCVIVLARQRFMLRADGTFPVAVRPQSAARWQYGVARYAGSEFRWYRSLGLGTRPNRVLRRPDVVLVSRRPPSSDELGAVPSSAVIVGCRDRDVDVTLALSDGAYTGFVSWLESSAPRA